MLELFWGILNTAILIYFIIICFKIVRIVRENLGGIATLIFVLGLMSFIAKPNDNKVETFDLRNENKKIEREKFNGDIFSKDIELERNLTSNINVNIQFGENETEKKLLYAQSNRSGFVSGIDWKMKDIVVNKINNDTYEYEVVGCKDWRILGIVIFTQSKEFNGKFVIKK